MHAVLSRNVEAHVDHGLRGRGIGQYLLKEAATTDPSTHSELPVIGIQQYLVPGV